MAVFNGIAHIAFTVTDMEASLAFYCGVVGMRRAFDLKDKDGNPWIEYLSFGGGQFVELFYNAEYTATPPYDDKRIGYHHFCVETKDITAMAKRLFDLGLIENEITDEGADGNRSCLTRDPDGNAVEFIQFAPDSPLVKDTPCSGRQSPGFGIARLAFRVKDCERSLRFYRDILGFPRQWALTKDGILQTYYLLARPGQIIEISGGATEALPDDNKRAGFAHVCIGVDDINEAVSRMVDGGVKIDTMPNRGMDLNHQAWVTDPDGVRIELMQIDPESPQAKSNGYSN